MGVLALRGNQKGLASDVTRLFEWAHRIAFAAIEHDHVLKTTKGHSWLEVRDCCTIADPRNVGELRQGRQWKSLRSVAQVQLERRDGEHVTVETRYYISSLPGSANRLRMRCACIGASRTRCISALTSGSTKMPVVFGSGPRLRISCCCAAGT